MKENYEEAIKDFSKVIELDPKNRIAYNNRGGCYWMNENYDEAIKDISKVIELGYEDADTYLLRAKCYIKKQQEYSEALNDISKAIELNPDLSPSFYLADRGKCHFEKGEYDKAQEDYDKFFELGYESYEAYKWRGDFYYKMKEYEKVKADYKQAYELTPSEEICHKLKSLYLEIEDLSNAAYMTWELFGYDVDFMYEMDCVIWKAEEIIKRKEREKAQTEIEHERKIAQARVDERNKVIADLSHSIKNLIKTVIDPLENLKQETVVRPRVIENALKGANLIREIVNAMNLSFRGSADDFYYDAKHNTGNDSLDFRSVIIESLKYSAGNMFDGKYFGKFQKKYFPTKEIYLSAKSEWSDVSQSDYTDMHAFMKKHLFEPDIMLGDAETYIMGNDRGSAVKLLILFQEIILNAVKYVSFVEKEERILRIRFSGNTDRISVKTENPFRPNVRAKTTGIGHVIVENFAKLLNAESPFVTKEGNLYSVEIRFPNFWEERKGQ